MQLYAEVRYEIRPMFLRKCDDRVFGAGLCTKTRIDHKPNVVVINGFRFRRLIFGRLLDIYDAREHRDMFTWTTAQTVCKRWRAVAGRGNTKIDLFSMYV